MEYYFRRYADLDVQRRMVSDQRRTEAFAAAIREVVREGHRVLDIGTGTGILAMLAARAGAAKVIGIDRSDVAKLAKQLVELNGLSEKIEIIQAPAHEIELDAPVDVLISEWLGHMALVEGMLDDVLAARDTNLAAGGVMIPRSVAVLLAPIADPVLYAYEGPGFWREPVQGFDFARLESLELEQGRAVQVRVERPALLAEAQVIAAIDLMKADVDVFGEPREVEFLVRRDGVLNGFVGWFSAALSETVVLDTGPHFPETHWAQTYLAFPPRLVRANERIVVCCAWEPHPSERRSSLLTLTLGEQSQTYVLE